MNKMFNGFVSQKEFLEIFQHKYTVNFYFYYYYHYYFYSLFLLLLLLFQSLFWLIKT
jgi:hypothetical protein